MNKDSSETINELTNESAETFANEPANALTNALTNTPATSFAYLGDAVYELAIRTRLIKDFPAMPAKLNKIALKYVNATAQAAFYEQLKPILTDEETSIFKRARNSKPHSVPKAASAHDYRMATGLEAIFGYLHLTGNDARINELVDMIYKSNKQD